MQGHAEKKRQKTEQDEKGTNQKGNERKETNQVRAPGQVSIVRPSAPDKPGILNDCKLSSSWVIDLVSTGRDQKSRTCKCYLYS